MYLSYIFAPFIITAYLNNPLMRTKTILLFVAIHLLLNGCVTYYPQAVDVPLIKKKGDIRIDAGAFLIPNINGTTDDSEPLTDCGIHATVTAGISNMLAVQTYVSVDVLSRLHFQTALGLYKRFENNTVTELYGGVGYGNGYMSALAGSAKDNYYLTFSQFNIGKTDLGKNHIDCGLGLKGGYLFTNTADNTSQTIYKKDGWMIEPTAFLRFGGNRAKFSTKVNYLWTNSIMDAYYFPVSVSFGVNFHAGKK